MSNTAPRNMPFAEMPNDQVASVAREFRDTVDYLYARIREVHCVSPLLMMGAFGIELFLKSLNSKCVYHQDDDLKELGRYLVTAQPMKKGHPLVEQFDDLAPELKAELESAYSKYPVVRGKNTIREALAVYDDLFVSSRYPFEREGNETGRSITALVELLDLIGDHVGSLDKRVSFN